MPYLFYHSNIFKISFLLVTMVVKVGGVYLAGLLWKSCSAVWLGGSGFPEEVLHKQTPPPQSIAQDSKAKKEPQSLRGAPPGETSQIVLLPPPFLNSESAARN